MKSINWRGYRALAWLGQALLAIFVIFASVQGNWLNALALGFFLIASLVFVIRDDKLPTLFDCLFVVAALLNALGWVWGLFNMPGPYDEIVHCYTTFSITLALSFLVYSSMLNIFRNHTLLYLLTIASFGIAIGAVWEVIEWSAGKILSTEVIVSLDDTIIDLIMDSLGAGLAALISLWGLQEWTNPQTKSEYSLTSGGR
ncbi:MULTISPECIES: hypothetical protein [unclassified Tolypothrix]|uniref:hypothetical protein n=1 Tax=unclassified Tolypothrix TaxID=2649714 RepID=UPI0005EAC7D0|nr:MULTISPECIES: hypothetical protein [unclassified Tolypothrix]BAY92744.1 hypothetical protein NIES3275_47810 [Microchaete diplosiphon NIES-3275]EKF05851.1 hypothetical protein FDUTEX481_00712 [Tolypothrix sp. PCC 7601]MBE9081498.1 hypothetical protein [Tolypothrix sp. LEGE 11397]UYD26667.1 hypothetical protein HGR01_00645 [Tolypothrix sp. PCC 7712]UYD37474.1 hypothetical protein HG267_18165 [Tolypothrix sp. PCC 7601]